MQVRRRLRFLRPLAGLLLALPVAAGAQAADLCQGFGPQTPRDIAAREGSNPRLFSPAPAAGALNLCNIHFHAQAEHKGPGFSLFAGGGEHGGYRCDATAELSEAEREDPAAGHGACHGVKPGDTIEVHWVYSSCAVGPGEGLGACLSESCANPQLRVESQVFLLANDPAALDFAAFDYAGAAGATHQPKALPEGTGEPVVFLGSTTGPQYSEAVCSPLQVTWSVRPECARLDIASLHAWCADNAFAEDHAHGVRALVTAPELLSAIE